ncbi:maleylpyruvate isomerase family mycothiol-dependent enzyme [Arthrobacter globiformis]|uniref:Maleylpyruvate isomerase family mycothiol-dependent enzyme n=1 Tax=Arthrobacter globiformis TaxID=1665 RepID=A0A328HCI3_ARTGO|nr:maleylpyruvate isomerase family mycothiol-dependent enzyme [Arthrobacter globiformis]RAM35851.1 maleylpyruvate isomerase family mycothiol-dependent enzyme [Arthrobacter globiformis]
MLPNRYIAELTSSLGALEVLARQPESTLNSPVPACPGWTLDALFGHLGSIERWAAAVVRGGQYVQEPAPPAEKAASWFLDGAPDFLATMTSLDPAAPCWNFGPPPRTAGFWLRRQAHEHAIHLVDAHQASGLADPEFAEDFMLDGIDEALAMFAPRQLRLQRMTDPGKAVTFRLPGGTVWNFGTGEVVASVTAAPQDMYLGLWGRASLSETAVLDGDVGLALRVIRGPLTP